MYLIVGLGNPGDKYEGTRHNAGFSAADELAARYGITGSSGKHGALCARGFIESLSVIIAKPQTFMNLSGEAVREIVDYYKIDPEREMTVIYDDISLNPGQIRVRKKGSAGGHNGIKNIISCLDTSVFSRVRIGIGDKREGQDLTGHVLGHFREEERAVMSEAYKAAADAAVLILKGRIDEAMNKYNRKK